MLSSLAIIIFALNFISSLAQKPVEPNRWLVKDVLIQRYPNGSKPSFGAEFEVTRSYYKECFGGPAIQAWEQGSLECGWLKVGQPLKCNNWVGEDLNSKAAPGDGSGYFSCKSYSHAAAGETSLPENLKNWVRWRIYDFQETTAPRNKTLFPCPFQSLKMEIVHGVPSAQ
jgi:hypothetical protein